MAEPLHAAISGGDAAFAAALAAALAVPAVHVPLAGLGGDAAFDGRLEHGLAWIHLVPSIEPAACEDDPFAEAASLLRAARRADEIATRAGVPLTFAALLPSPGMHTGPSGIACDLALTGMRSLMRVDLARWSSPARRIVGVVRGGVEGYEPAGQRPLEEVRQRTPMTVLSTVGQVAGALRYACSGRASYVTGTFLRVDGGWDAYSWVYPTRTV